MKLLCSVILLVIFKVISSYPSSDSDTYPEKIFSSFEIINPAVGILSPYLDDDAHISSENHFPEVEYPTKMLVDTIEPFFYHAADHDDILAPFTSDVKDSYKSEERKVKENSAHEDCSVSPSEFNIQHIIKESDGSITSDSLFNPVESAILTSYTNTSDISAAENSETNNYSQASNEEEVEATKDVSTEPSDETNIEPVPIDTTEASIATQDNSSESKHSDEEVSFDSVDEESL